MGLRTEPMRQDGSERAGGLTAAERHKAGEGLYCFQLSQLPLFLSLMAGSQQSHPSQQCLPVSPLDIESAPKKHHQ